MDKSEQCMAILGKQQRFNKSAMIDCYRIWKTANKQEQLEINYLFRDQLHLATEEQVQWTHRLMQGLIDG